MGAKDSLSSERAYTLRILSQGVMRGLADTLFHRDLTGFARTGAIVVGLAVTTAGYLVGSTFLRVANLKNIIDSKKITHHDLEVEAGIALESELTE